MNINEETRKKVEEEFEKFKNSQYAGHDKKERQKKGQFFTPAKMACDMLEKFDDTNGTILDPAGGNGNLLVAAIFAGFDPKKVYYNELDPDVFEIGKERLHALGVPYENMHIGNALEDSAYDF